MESAPLLSIQQVGTEGGTTIFRLRTRSEESLKVLLCPRPLTRHRSPITPKRSNPFQGGMGFFTLSGVVSASYSQGRNPFQGGMGFFTAAAEVLAAVS